MFHHLLGFIFSKKGLILLLHFVAYIGWFAFTVYTYTGKTYSDPADAVIVLDGGVVGNEPTEQFKKSLKMAAEIYRKGFAKRIIITGGVGRGNRISSGLAGGNYIIQFGIYPSDLMVEERTKSPYQNMFMAGKMADEAGLGSFIVVGAPLQMKRVKMYAKELRMSVQLSPTEGEITLSSLMKEVYRYHYHAVMENIRSTKEHPEIF